MQTDTRPHGIALGTGAILIVITMALHPVGGDIEHLQRIIPVAMATHALAIFSIPLMLFGFWGIFVAVGRGGFFATWALMVAGLGLVAVMLAAAVNGLALPLFIQHYAGAVPETTAAIKPILLYNYSLNHAFDYIYIVSACLSSILFSISILKGNCAIPIWVGYCGIVAGVTGVAVLVSGFVLVDLRGFRLFVFAYVLWLFVAAYFMAMRRRE